MTDLDARVAALIKIVNSWREDDAAGFDVLERAIRVELQKTSLHEHETSKAKLFAFVAAIRASKGEKM